MLSELTEQRHFVFDAVVAFLSSIISEERGILTLLAMSDLFHCLGYEQSAVESEHRLILLLDDLNEIEKSGFQLRDCLAVSKYALQSDLKREQAERFCELVAPRIEFAVAVNWFNEPELASTIIEISDSPAHVAYAMSYLTSNYHRWLNDGYVLGVVSYARVTRNDEEVLSFLETVDWGVETIHTLSVVLVTLGWMVRRGHSRAVPLRHRIAETIYGHLYTCRVVEHVFETFDSSDTRHVEAIQANYNDLTTYDLALAASALCSEEYQFVVGVHLSQKEMIQQALELLETTEKGGTYLSRGQLRLYELAIFAFLFMLVHWLAQLAGVRPQQAIAGAILEWLVPILVAFLALLLLSRVRPGSSIFSMLFGTEDKDSNEP